MNKPEAGNTVQSGTGPLWAWRLTKEVKNASDGALEAGIGICGWWAGFAGWMLVFGLLGEVAVAFLLLLPKSNPTVQIACTIVANAIVALSVFSELRFSHWSGAFQSELTQRSNDRLTLATDRASNAEQETQKLRIRAAELEMALANVRRNVSSRYITDDERAKLAAALLPHVAAFSQGVRIDAMGTTNDQAAFAKEIAEALNAAGVQARVNVVQGLFLTEERGLHVWDTPNGTLSFAFAAAGIPLSVDGIANPGMPCATLMASITSPHNFP